MLSPSEKKKDDQINYGNLQKKAKGEHPKLLRLLQSPCTQKKENEKKKRTSSMNAASMFPWMTMLLFAMEENLSGIEEVETLRNNLRDEIGNRVRESEILTKASFFHPTYSLLYKQCNEENFDALKDLLRREMQDIAPSVSAPVQPAGEGRTTTYKLARAMQRLYDMQNAGVNGRQNNEAPGDELDRYFQCVQCQDFKIDPLDWWR
jgi:hypothetical protein